jgi:hypothetical protein
MWEVFPYIGSLPMYAKSSHIQEDFPHMGKPPHVWGVSPDMEQILTEKLKFVQFF